MVAVTETLQTINQLAGTGYKFGFETDIEMDVAPKGLNEKIIRLISEKKAGTGLVVGMAAEIVSRLALYGGAGLGANCASKDRIPGIALLRGTQRAGAKITRRR